MHLFNQLGLAAILAVAAALIHGFGVVAIASALGLDRPQPRTRRLHPRTAIILGGIGLMLLLLHMIEVALFGGLYLAVGTATNLEEALYFSASAYSTLGNPDPGFAPEWRLLAAIEGVVGFLMLGWSTAFFVTDMNKLLRA